MDTKPQVFVVNDARSVYESLGITKSRAEELIKHVRKLLFDNLVHPFNDKRITQASDLMHAASEVCENYQELGYVMYKLGYEQYHVEESIRQQRAAMEFAKALGEIDKKSGRKGEDTGDSE